MAQDIFNQPSKNARNRKTTNQLAAEIADAHNKSVNQQIVEDQARRDATDAKGRVLLPDLTGAEQTIAQENKRAKDMKTFVERIGVKIAHDTAFNITLENTYAAKRIADNGALYCASHLERLLSTEEIISLPVGGETEKDVEKTNRVPDKYSKSYYDRVEAVKRTKQTSFYRELAEQMDASQAWLTRWENFRFASKRQFDKIKGDASDYKRKNAAAYEQEVGVCSDAINAFTKWIRQATMFERQLQLAKRSKNVVVYVGKDETGNYFQRKRPVTLRAEPPTDEQYTTMTVASFLNIDIDAAIDNGDTWDTWEAQFRREPTEGGEEDGDMVKSVVDFEASVTAIHSWIEAAGSARERYTELLTAVTKKGSDDLCLSIYSLHSLLDGIIPHIKERVARLAQAEAARQEQDATMTKEQQGVESAALVNTAALANTRK